MNVQEFIYQNGGEKVNTENTCEVRKLMYRFVFAAFHSISDIKTVDLYVIHRYMYSVLLTHCCAEDCVAAVSSSTSVKCDLLSALNSMYNWKAPHLTYL